MPKKEQGLELYTKKKAKKKINLQKPKSIKLIIKIKFCKP